MNISVNSFHILIQLSHAIIAIGFRNKDEWVKIISECKIVDKYILQPNEKQGGNL